MFELGPDQSNIDKGSLLTTKSSIMPTLHFFVKWSARITNEERK
jgi:hypothetical protein